MKSILFPTDFSGNNDVALKYAVKLAKDNGAILSILHVKHTYLDATMASVGSLSVENVPIPEALLLHIEDIKTELKSISGLKFEIILRDGFLNDEILRVAEEKNSDLVIIGTKSAHNKLNIWLENNAAYLITKRKLPVLAVPDTFEATSASNEIVFATDFQHIHDWDRLEIVRELALKTKSKINLFNVRIHKADLEEKLSENDRIEQFENFFSDITLEVHHAFKTTSITEAVEKFAHDIKAQLIIMISHDMGFLEGIFHKSISKEMAIYAQVPFLAIPDAKMIENETGVTQSDLNII